jgi:hypothetical protein
MFLISQDSDLQLECLSSFLPPQGVVSYFCRDALVRLVEDLAAQPNASVPQASGDLAATQAAYEFWSSPHIKAQAIGEAHQKSTLERVKQHTIIIGIQDTTEVNFTHHPSKKGMGYLDNANSRGLKVHSELAIAFNGLWLPTQLWRGACCGLPI